MNGNLSIFVLTACFLLALPQPGEAYLDPASGNALVYTLVAQAGAGLYAVKGAYYWAAKRVGVIRASSGGSGLFRRCRATGSFQRGAQLLERVKPVVQH